MPIEIRELVIRAVIDPPREPAVKDAPTDRTALIEQCVAEVMRRLARAQEP